MRIESFQVHAFIGGSLSKKIDLPIGSKFMSLSMRDEGIYAYYLVPELEVPNESIEYVLGNSKSSIDSDKMVYRGLIEYIHDSSQLIIFHLFEVKS